MVSEYNRSEFFDLSGAYIIKHVSTGKLYIGSTKNLYSRLNQHKNELTKNVHYNKLLQDAFNTNNSINFEIFITDKREEAYDIEQELLNKFKDSGLLFNVANDVKASFRGRKHTIEFKNKVSVLHRNKIVSEDTRKKMSVRATGRKFSQDSVEKRRSITLKRMSDPVTKSNQIDINPKRESVSINGIIYKSKRQAALKNNTSHNMVTARIKSTNPIYKDWISIEDHT